LINVVQFHGIIKVLLNSKRVINETYNLISGSNQLFTHKLQINGSSLSVPVLYFHILY